VEHRWGERLEVALPVRIRAPFGLIGTGLVVNFSVSGAFIATTLPVAPLSRVSVSFRFGRRAARIMQLGSSTFEAQVVRQNAAGFAVEWCEFGTQDVVAFANSNRGHGQFTHYRPSAPASNLLSAKRP
jgi:PilZ domain-containing protein